jgi:hypothetical protein
MFVAFGDNGVDAAAMRWLRRLRKQETVSVFAEVDVAERLPSLVWQSFRSKEARLVLNSGKQQTDQQGHCRSDDKKLDEREAGHCSNFVFHDYSFVID